MPETEMVFRTKETRTGEPKEPQAFLKKVCVEHGLSMVSVQKEISVLFARPRTPKGTAKEVEVQARKVIIKMVRKVAEKQEVEAKAEVARSRQEEKVIDQQEVNHLQVSRTLDLADNT